MKQNSFLAIAENKKRLRCEKFLEEIGTVVPWKDFCDEIEPYYVEKETGRPKTNDRIPFRDLLHGEEKAIFGDKAYAKQSDKRECRARGILWAVKDRASFHSGKSGASVSGTQMTMGLCESTIQRFIQKYHAAFCTFFSCESFPRSKNASRYGMTREHHAQPTKKHQNRTKKSSFRALKTQKFKKISKNHPAGANALFFSMSLSLPKP